jgi:leucyl aminopeptidase
MDELYLYKNIIMDPNKNPLTYLKYVKSRVPKNYKCKHFNINKSNLFPLSKAVGIGSIYDSYFIHIHPKKIDAKKKSIYLIGKGVCFDSGGMNLKIGDFSDMKIDMTGSALIISVLNLLVKNNLDKKYNIHILSSLVENMISNTATKPGMVIEALNGKTVEIINTDAEGRLCLVDGINYVNKFLLKKQDSYHNAIIIDIATLTGNAHYITSSISSLVMFNDKGYKFINKLNDIGEAIGEYIDYLKIRKEYNSFLSSTVADIKNINLNIKADCILAGTFLSYFVDKKIPWLHIDLGDIIYTKSTVLSYGIYLLYEFIKQLD